VLQLSSAGRADQQLYSSVDLRISYRTKVYSSLAQDITRVYAVDIFYRYVNKDYTVSISTEGQDNQPFVVTVNGMTMKNPAHRPLLLSELRVKQMTNYAVLVSSADFDLEFDIDCRIYVRLESRFEKKVHQWLKLGAKVVGNARKRLSEARHFCSMAFPALEERFSPLKSCINLHEINM